MIEEEQEPVEINLTITKKVIKARAKPLNYKWSVSHHTSLFDDDYYEVDDMEDFELT